MRPSMPTGSTCHGSAGLRSWRARRALPQRNVLLGVGSSEQRRWITVSATPLSIRHPSERVDRIIVSVRDVTTSKVSAKPSNAITRDNYTHYTRLRR